MQARKPYGSGPNAKQVMTDVEPSSLTETDRRLMSLMAAAQNGDRATYDQLLRLCIPVVERIARQRGVQAESVDDVVQDVLLTVHRARHTYDPSRSFLAWLSAIARNRAIDALRRHGRRSRRELHNTLAYETHPDVAPDPARAWEQASEARALRKAIETLAPGQRDAVERLGLREQSLTEAAEEGGRNKNTLKVGFHRAIAALRARLSGVE